MPMGGKPGIEQMQKQIVKLKPLKQKVYLEIILYLTSLFPHAFTVWIEVTAETFFPSKWVGVPPQRKGQMQEVSL